MQEKPVKPLSTQDSSQWTFFSNHAHVLVCIALRGDAPLREVARHVGITERATQRIVADLCATGVLVRYREGRQNRYRLDLEQPLRHPLEKHATIGQILEVLKFPQASAGSLASSSR